MRFWPGAHADDAPPHLRIVGWGGDTPPHILSALGAYSPAFGARHSTPSAPRFEGHTLKYFPLEPCEQETRTFMAILHTHPIGLPGLESEVGLCLLQSAKVKLLIFYIQERRGCKNMSLRFVGLSDRRHYPTCSSCW